MRIPALFALATLALGCGPGDEGPGKSGETKNPATTTTSSWSGTGEFDDAGGLSGQGLMNPFPNMWLMKNGKVEIPADQLPETNTPFPSLRVSHRTGFSRAQPITLRIPDLDCTACPSWNPPTPGEGSVLLFDRTTMEWLPVMAELDAADGAVHPTLIIRPQIALPLDHQIGVIVTTDAVERPARFDGLADGTADSVLREHYVDLMADIDTMGIAPDDVALAWDFPVGDGTIKARSAVAQVEVPTSWTFQFVKEADLGDNVPGPTWRTGRGTFETVSFLNGDKLSLNTDATAVITGTENATLVIAIPDSVKDAPADSVPVLLYGHTLLGSAKSEVFDFYTVIHDVANRSGMIVVATDWGGLDSGDMLVAVGVSQDFGKMPNLTGKMVQGQANVQGLIKLAIEGALFDDPVMLGVSGQRLADPDRVYYWGMSLGGILGGVVAAQEGPVEAAVLNIGGGGWASLLERSSNWNTFEFMVDNSLPAAEDRQLYYAVSQLFWDPVDPVSYADDLQNELVLLQESYGDDAVCNMSTRMLARSLDLPVLTPDVDAPWGLTPAPADLPAGSRAMVQFDPERGVPPDVNRPAPLSGAHTATSGWLVSVDQAVEFLSPGLEGQVVHLCGAQACSESNH